MQGRRRTTRARSFAFGARMPGKRIKCRRGRGTSAARRSMKSTGVISRWVVPSRQDVLSSNATRHGAGPVQLVVGEGRAGDGTAQAGEPGAIRCTSPRHASSPRRWSISPAMPTDWRAVGRSSARRYSISSSAPKSMAGGTVSPSALAVFRLITSSNFVGCSTGRSAGFAPFKILTTDVAAR
jgi:hypothetical protein